MGGNYLPDTNENEVEIARIEIASVTLDVPCLYAKPENGQIRYRVVDEYEGDTLSDLRETTSNEPLKLGDMVNFFLKAWPLIDVLEMNCENDVDCALSFFVAKSDFYPEFDLLCRQCVRNALLGLEEEEKEDEVGHDDIDKDEIDDAEIDEDEIDDYEVDGDVSDAEQGCVVMLVVPEWPGGTMAMKFGSALESALDVTEDEMKLVQMKPERIFRVVTRVTEGEFRKKLKSYNVSCSGKVHFWEV